jgi:hypothetical protein
MRNVWVWTGIASVVLAVLLVLPLAGVWGLPFHESCVRTADVGQPVLWTPLAVLDSPLNGSANATALMLGPGGQPEPGIGTWVNASDGASLGVFILLRWSVYSIATEITAGPGPGSPCRVSYGAVPSMASPASPRITVALLIAGSASDSNMPDSVQAQGIGSLVFNADWPGGKDAVQTCGSSGVGGGAAAELSGVLAVIPGESYGGHNVSVNVPDDVSYNYYFPKMGAWGIGESPSAGLAFTYYGC